MVFFTTILFGALMPFVVKFLKSDKVIPVNGQISKKKKSIDELSNLERFSFHRLENEEINEKYVPLK